MKIDDILLNGNETRIMYSEVDDEYMEKVKKDFIKFIKKMDFKPTETGYSCVRNAYKNESNKVIISIWACGRSFELSVYYDNHYDKGKKYYEKKYVELYVLKCFNWIIEYNKNLEFSSNGKVRNYLKDDKEKNKTTPEQKIIKDFRDSCWHKPDAKKEDFKLSDWDGTTVESYNNCDRDKKVIYNGDIKYFYNWHGFLCKGKVYHHINNMWWVICNDKLYYNVASFDLFDLTEQDLKCRRKKPHILPEKYLDKISEEDKAPVLQAIEKLRETVKTDNTEAIKADTDALTQSFYKIAEKLYQQNPGATPGQDAGAQGGFTGDDGVYNADFTDKSEQ